MALSPSFALYVMKATTSPNKHLLPLSDTWERFQNGLALQKPVASVH